MLKEHAVTSRTLRTRELTADFAVVGGGMAGTCAAITAARAGASVILLQDRPVLGGNASSEVRLWTLGATSHMNNNNRWAREGGLIDELMVENLWRNPDGNPFFFDALLLEKATAEPNLTLLLNTAVSEAHCAPDGRIESVSAFCSQNSTRYEVTAPLFCDASGDGILGFLSGAPFRMGAEAQAEFGEKFAPTAEYGELLGHSLYFYTKDSGHPVRYVPPAFALSNVPDAIPRFRSFNAKEYGCRLWWIEYGGRLDTVHDTEAIKWELWRVVYGVWDYIKNSGKFPEAANLTLEWVGAIPGKRESRRFEGDYWLRQQDIVEQTLFPDVVAFGGWSIDLHPADGIFSEKPGCNQWHSKGIYGIPYRSYYSRTVPNLFLAGRIISATHVAFGSSRVMATCAHGGQAVGMAAALCAQTHHLPRALDVRRLQMELLRSGQHLPGLRLQDPDDLAQQASLTASSQLRLDNLPAGGPDLPLNVSRALLLPLNAGLVPAVTITVDAAEATELVLELRTCSHPDSHTPDTTLAVRRITLPAGMGQSVEAAFPDVTLNAAQYVFLCLMANPAVTMKTSTTRITGVLSLVQRSTQQPASDIGVDTFEFWTPERRPEGHLWALTANPPLDVFGLHNITNGVQRPTHAPNAWVADPTDPLPTLTLRWAKPQTMEQISLAFDADWDHPMETVLWGHPESAMPYCVRHFRVRDGAGNVIWEVHDNHQTRCTRKLEQPVTTDCLHIECVAVWDTPNVPAALFEVRCYAPA